MNERIRQLILEAGGRNNYSFSETQPWKFSETEVEKFAKLIIHECATLKLDPIQIDEAQYYHGWLDYRDFILEHFKD